MRLKVLFITSVFIFRASSKLVSAQNSTFGWKAGVAKVMITSQQLVWMTGYAARDHESEGVLYDLWTKALPLGDSNSKQAVVVSSDFIGYRGGNMTGQFAISNAKRMLSDVFHDIKPEYQQKYLNEFCYKFNRRYFGERRFDRLMIAAVSSKNQFRYNIE